MNQQARFAHKNTFSFKFAKEIVRKDQWFSDMFLIEYELNKNRKNMKKSEKGKKLWTYCT